MLEDLKRRPSALVLVLANLIPLVGVIFWGWSVFNIVALYWMENLIIGAINILKMITCRADLDELAAGQLVPDELRDGLAGEQQADGGMGGAALVQSGLKLFMIPFFTVHYFGFCAGHGFFVLFMFGRESGFLGGGGGLFSPFAEIPNLLSGALGLAALGLVVSHLYSFFSNYIGGGEYRRTPLPVLMFQPYGRIVVLHVAIIFGGFVVMSLDSPLGLLIILILGKIVIDLKLHLREHRDSAEGGTKLRSPLMEAFAQAQRGRGKH